MNIQDTSASRSAYAIGEPVKRKEDSQLLRGQGRYTDDINLPKQAYAYMLRSSVAHGRIKSINTDAARKMKGVLAVYTGEDVKSYGTIQSGLPFKSRDGSDMKKPGRAMLPTDKVRFVGDPVACVVAETLLQAKDAAEAIELDIEALPVVVDFTKADAKGAPAIFEDIPDNVALDYHYGDAEKVNAAFAGAAHKVKLKIQNSRLVVNAMEPRAAVGEYDKAKDSYTLHSVSQGVMGLKAGIVGAMKTTPDKVHILSGHVGGSFGMKAPVYPEYVCILHGAKMLGRPVKWTDERSSSFVSDSHGRDHEQTAELALDAEGHFLALRINGYGNLGGFQSQMGPQAPTLNTVRNAISLYQTPLMEVNTKVVFTNTTQVAPYRGAGRPEGNYYMERLIDYAAAVTGFDRIDLRRKNQIRKSQIPWKSAAGTTYDSGDFPALLKKALEASDWKGFNKRKRESKKRGKVRGIGIGCFLEVTAPANKEMGGIAFDADGGVTIRTGTLDYGQGHATPFAQVLSDRLGVPFDKVRILQGDSDELHRRRRHRRLALDDELRPGHRGGRGQGGRARPADRLARAGGLGRRHRVQGRQVCRRRHRPADRHHGIGAEGPHRHEPAGRRSAVARRQARQRGLARRLSERLPCLRGRGRSRHRHHRAREVSRGQRLRHHHQSDADRRADPRRRCAGARPVPARAGRL